MKICLIELAKIGQRFTGPPQGQLYKLGLSRNRDSLKKFSQRTCLQKRYANQQKKPEKKKEWRTRRGQVDIPPFFSISKRNKKGPSPWTKTVVFNMYQLPNRASTPPPPSPTLTLGCLSVILPGQEWAQRISGLPDPEDLGLVFEPICHPIRLLVEAHLAGFTTVTPPPCLGFRRPSNAPTQ